MCWSGEASAVLATCGFASTTYVAVKGEDKNVWLPLGYFSLMEALQAATYSVIDQCALPSNQVLTLLGFLHISFQPFFINMASMHFIPPERRARIATLVYSLCLFGTMAFLVRLYPFDWAGACIKNWHALCGDRLCSVHGSWHIAWEVPLNGLSWLGWGYYFPAFLLPIIYGSWRFTLYHILVGPTAALLTTSSWNEWPAVWCLFSIGLLLVVIKTPVRKILYQRRWFF